MATTYLEAREVELAVKEEATYGTDPGSWAAGDFFKHTSRLHITPEIGKYFRDRETAYQNASVTDVTRGRIRSGLKIDVEAIPSGDGTTITAPDIDLLLKNHMGTKATGTAHTTTTSGSVGTTLKLTAGGGAASGVAVGMLIAVDVSSTYGYEVRRVTGVSTDDVTVNAAFSADPATGRTVKLGVTYKLLTTYQGSLYLLQWIAGTSARHAVPGVVLPQFEANINFADREPILRFSFSGMGKFETTHSESRATPTTAGEPLLPAESKLFFGATKYCPLSFAVNSNSGLALRESTSCSLEPTGVQRTGNNGRYNVDARMSLLLSTGDVDTAAAYNTAKSLGGLDVIMQCGITPGAIVAFAMPNYVPDPVRGESDGMFTVDLAGRALGSSSDDELRIAFI